jgi:hypothetical protein
VSDLQELRVQEPEMSESGILTRLQPVSPVRGWAGDRMMLTIFRKRKSLRDQMQDAVKEFNEEHLPHGELPDVDVPVFASLGDDIDLSRVVNEVAPRQLNRITLRRQQLMREMEALDRTEQQLKKLLSALA